MRSRHRGIRAWSVGAEGRRGACCCHDPQTGRRSWGPPGGEITGPRSGKRAARVRATGGEGQPSDLRWLTAGTQPSETMAVWLAALSCGDVRRPQDAEARVPGGDLGPLPKQSPTSKAGGPRASSHSLTSGWEDGGQSGQGHTEHTGCPNLSPWSPSDALFQATAGTGRAAGGGLTSQSPSTSPLDWGQV